MKWNLRLAAAHHSIWTASEMRRMLAARDLAVSGPVQGGRSCRCCSRWLVASGTSLRGALASHIFDRSKWLIGIQEHANLPFTLRHDDMMAGMLPVGSFLVRHPSEKAPFFSGLLHAMSMGFWLNRIEALCTALR
jgi:hypothetical protein